MIVGMEKYGKILDKCDADLDNCDYPCIFYLVWISWDNSSQIRSNV